MRAKRACLCGCGLLVTGSRCPTSRAAQRAKYQGDWPTISRTRIAAHVATHGWWCPGHGIPAHPSADLTLDHSSDTVLCRGCNTRSKNLGDG